MAAVVIRNLTESTHQALKRRAKAHGRSTEAEIRDILEKAVGPATPAIGKLGTDLHKLWKETGEWALDLPPRAEPIRIVDFSSPGFGEADGDDP